MKKNRKFVIMKKITKFTLGLLILLFVTTACCCGGGDIMKHDAKVRITYSNGDIEVLKIKKEAYYLRFWIDQQDFKISWGERSSSYTRTLVSGARKYKVISHTKTPMIN